MFYHARPGRQAHCSPFTQFQYIDDHESGQGSGREGWHLTSRCGTAAAQARSGWTACPQTTVMSSHLPAMIEAIVTHQHADDCPTAPSDVCNRGLVLLFGKHDARDAGSKIDRKLAMHPAEVTALGDTKPADLSVSCAWR